MKKPESSIKVKNRAVRGRLAMNKKHLLTARPGSTESPRSELVEGRGRYTAMVRQAHHERFINDLYSMTVDIMVKSICF